MEPPIARVLIFCLALRTHRKMVHSGVCAVIGKALNDAEAWSTVGTVGEGIMVAAVGRVNDFMQAISAERDVWENQHRFIALHAALTNFKMLITERVKPGCCHGMYPCQRWLFFWQACQEGLQDFSFPFNFNEDAVGIIDNPATQGKISCQSVDKRAKANTLNSPLNFKSQTTDHCRKNYPYPFSERVTTPLLV
jgi:hypothetical protein